jgi:hypothetical protein
MAASHARVQRHAAKGDFDAAMLCLFEADAAASLPPPAGAAAGAGGSHGSSSSSSSSSSRAAQYEVADAVLRLAAAAAASNDCLRCVRRCAGAAVHAAAVANHMLPEVLRTPLPTDRRQSPHQAAAGVYHLQGHPGAGVAR